MLGTLSTHLGSTASWDLIRLYPGFMVIILYLTAVMTVMSQLQKQFLPDRKCTAECCVLPYNLTM